MGVRPLNPACHAGSLRRGELPQGEPAHTAARFPANPPSGESGEKLQGRPRRAETVESDKGSVRPVRPDYCRHRCRA